MIYPRPRLQATIHHLPQLGLVYLNNAKVGCSSIKKALWSAVTPFPEGRSPHDRGDAPFSPTLNDLMTDKEPFLRATFFSVVRNPYARILSAYLDKVHREKRDTAVWHPFARRFRLSGDARPSFGEFLRLVASEDPSLLDQHFAPQYVNILQPLVACNFIGHLEDMTAVWGFLNRFKVEPADHRPHTTNAGQATGQFYGPAEIELVRSFYRADFDAFGYSDDPSVVSPVRPVRQAGRPRSVLDAFLTGFVANRPEVRRSCFDQVEEQVPDLATCYNELETRSVGLVALQEMANKAISGDVRNWKLVALIAEELLRRDMIDQAVSVTHRAKLLMHPG